MDFVSSSNNNTNSTNGVVNTAQAVNTTQAVNTAYEVSTSSTQVNVAYSIIINNLSDAVIYSFSASQPNSPQLAHDDLEQIHPDDIGKKINTARPKAVVNAVKGNNYNAVKALACWVWKPKHKVLDHVSKPNSASITLKKFDYVDTQCRSKPKAVVNAVKGNNYNAVKALACWVWKPKHKVLDHVSKPNSESITLKKFDYQHQNEVNEIRVERLARTANPLALVAQQQQVYHPQNHPTHYTQNSLTRSQQAATRNREKAIVNSPPPIYDQEPSMVAEDDEMSKDKEIDKLMALISLSFKKIYKPTNNLQTSSNISRANQDNSPRISRGTGYDNQKMVNVARARETVGTTVVQKYGIQCYNYKEYGHVARECQKPKRAKDAAYHKEKMLLCKQEEAGFQLNAKQADWRDDTDDEPEDQELEAHYMYMAQIQEGNDLLTGSRGTDLYSITLQYTSSPNLIFLMAKATSFQAWLWHRRLFHLNFNSINLLSKNDIVIGLPKLKFVKDHLCSSCELRKAKRKSFQTKTTPNSKSR
nr:retrovirus-related Pol polyprotein from transposon TNT 1-94 [Tanacetum cinerariifolium]